MIGSAIAGFAHDCGMCTGSLIEQQVWLRGLIVKSDFISVESHKIVPFSNSSRQITPVVRNVSNESSYHLRAYTQFLLERFQWVTNEGSRHLFCADILS